MDKRIPMRTCMGCREVRPKKELLRIVRKNGEEPDSCILLPDVEGTQNGRGAYLCRSMECYDKAVKRRGFNRSFRTTVSPEELNILRKEVEEVLEGRLR
jgi:hypothetical protein